MFRSLVVALAVLALFLGVFSLTRREPSAGVRRSLVTTPERTDGPGDEVRAPEDGDSAPAGEARVPAEPEGERPGAPRETSDTELATLRVRVIAVETGAPVRDVRVDLNPVTSRGIERRVVDASEARLGQIPRTDAAGAATYRVPPDSYRLRVRGRDDLQASLADVQSKEVEVHALFPGEVREEVVSVLTGDDLLFHGRVVDARTNAPVAEASVAVLRPRVEWKDRAFLDRSERLDERVADLDGRFQFAVPSWKPLLARIEAAGYAATYVPVLGGHERAEDALVVELEPGASVDARILEHGAPVEGLTVVLATRIEPLLRRPAGDATRYEHAPLTWSATTGPAGTCRLAALPGGVPLAVRLLRDGEELTKELAPLWLEPGEEREVTWNLGAGTTLLGVARDPEGRPQAGLEIWLDAAEYGDPARRFARTDGAIDDRARTDDEGRFRFEDVRPGDWWIGPGEPDATSAREAPAPVAERIRIEAGESEHRLDLTVFAGLFVSGRVLDPGGEPVAETAVFTSGWGGAFTRTGEDGGFVLGPLKPGDYELTADALDAWRSSEPVVAAAGAEGVVLLLRASLSLRGRVLAGASGEPARTTVCLSELGRDDIDGGYVDEEDVRADGTFQFNALGPGHYSVFAKSTRGEVGFVRDVLVEADAEPVEVLVPLEPGGRIRVRCEPPGEEVLYVVALADGRYLDESLLHGSGAGVTLATPPGACLVRLYRSVAEPEGWEVLERALTVLSGEEQEVVFQPLATPFRRWVEPPGR